MRSRGQDEAAGGVVDAEAAAKQEAAAAAEAYASVSVAGRCCTENEEGQGGVQPEMCVTVDAELASFSNLAKLFSASTECPQYGADAEGGGDGLCKRGGWGGGEQSRRKSAAENRVLSVTKGVSCRAAISGAFRRLSM
jgi:hypothetical protein